MATNLEKFVLNYLNLHNALVERPRYGIVEALLPEEEAQQLACDSYLRLTFSDEIAEAESEITHLTISHPLMERMIERARTEGQTTRRAIHPGRLQKPKLFELIKEKFFLPNAWVSEIRDAVTHPQRHYYVHFNFKIAFVSDEKQEELSSIWMDLNRGIPAPALDDPQTAVIFVDESQAGENDPAMPTAPLLWAADLDPLGKEALQALLERAAQSVTSQLGERLRQLKVRSARLLELDLARLNAFYDETERDLERRISRSQDETRIENLRSKLAFAQADRGRKLADVQEKYRLRVNVELLNAALVVQPKVALRVQVENRYRKMDHTFIWDPVLHELEMPLCAVCQKPFRRLHLCTNGHLMCDAHTHNCDLCKREYCTLCEESLTQCATCGRTICPSSQIRCKSCGNLYCADHQKHPHG
jgi:hypothetical protein